MASTSKKYLDEAGLQEVWNRTVGRKVNYSKSASSTTGTEVFNDYTRSITSGKYAHIEGGSINNSPESYALGDYSHTEGLNCESQGKASHAEGIGTIASSEGEHVEGKYNSVMYRNIHNVGIGSSNDARKSAHIITMTGKHYIPGIGTYTGIENPLPVGQDLASIITGISNNVNQKISDAPDATKVYGRKKGSWVEIPKSETIDLPITKGSGTNSIEQTSNTATGQYSQALGSSSIALGSWSHTEGYDTRAGNSTSDYAPHAEGYRTIATGDYGSHAEGYYSAAYGNGSHAEGYNTNIMLSYTGSFWSSNKALYMSKSTWRSYFRSKCFINQRIKINNTDYIIISSGLNDTTSGNPYIILDKIISPAISSNSQTTIEFYINGAYGTGSHIEGKGNVTIADGSHACGIYNQPIDNAIFTVGVGHDNHDRRNAMVIDNSGNVYIDGINDFNNSDFSLNVSNSLGNKIQNIDNTLTKITQGHNVIMPNKHSKGANYMTQSIWLDNNDHYVIFNILTTPKYIYLPENPKIGHEIQCIMSEWIDGNSGLPKVYVTNNNHRIRWIANHHGSLTDAWNNGATYVTLENQRGGAYNRYIFIYTGQNVWLMF